MPLKEPLGEPPVLRGFRLDCHGPSRHGVVPLDAPTSQPNHPLTPSPDPPPNAPGTESLGSPVLKGFRLPDNMATSRQAATSFAAQPVLAVSSPDHTSNPAPNPPPNTPEAGSLLSPTLKGFRLPEDSKSTRQTAISFAAPSPPPKATSPSFARHLKSPPPELRKRAKLGSISAALTSDTRSEHLQDASQGQASTQKAPAEEGLEGSASQPVASVSRQVAPEMKGFRLPGLPGRAAALSFIAPPKAASGKNVLEESTSEVGLSIVLSPTTAGRAGSPSPQTSPAIIYRGEGQGALTWSDVINGASPEETTAAADDTETCETEVEAEKEHGRERKKDDGQWSETDEQVSLDHRESGAIEEEGLSWNQRSSSVKENSLDKDESGRHKGREIFDMEHSADRIEGIHRRTQRAGNAKAPDASDTEQVVEDKQATEVRASNEGAFGGGKTAHLPAAADPRTVQSPNESEGRTPVSGGKLGRKGSGPQLPRSSEKSEPPENSSIATSGKPSSPVSTKSPRRSDKATRSESPPVDQYLLCEPYRPSTFGEPACPTSGGRPLTAERPPSSETVGRYTYSERPMSAERWVAPSEREPRNGEVRKVPHRVEVSVNSENLHSAAPPHHGGHVSAPQWPPEAPLSPPSLAGLGVTMPLNPNSYPAPFDPQQMQAHCLQQHQAFSLPFPNPAFHPYLNPHLNTESSLASQAADSAFLGASPYWQSLSQLANPLTQSQAFARPPNTLTQSQTSPLHSSFNPFQYPQIPHPYFPYGPPPSFYPMPPVSYPYGPAPLNQLPQGSVPVSFPGAPSAPFPNPPSQYRPSNSQEYPNWGLPLHESGLQRTPSASRSELLKARDIAVQRALMRASTQRNPSPPLSAPGTVPANGAPASSQHHRVPDVSSPQQPLCSQSTRSHQQPVADLGARGKKTSRGDVPNAATHRATQSSKVAQGSTRVHNVWLDGEAYLSEGRTETRLSSKQNGNHHLESQKQTNGQSNPQGNPGPNQPLNRLLTPTVPLEPSPSYSTQSLPSYDDFLEFLRCRPAYAAHAAPMMQSAAPLNGALLVPTQPPPSNSWNHPEIMLTLAAGHLVGAPPVFHKVTSAKRGASVEQKGTAAFTIQRLWKEQKRRRREKRAEEAPERQTGMLLTWRYRARFLCLRQTAVRLQAIFRTALARRRFLAVKWAVQIIQRTWKRFRASLSSWQLGKLRELRGLYLHAAGNLEARGLEASPFRRFAALMERLVAATEGARVRRRLNTRRARVLVTEMKDISELLQQLEVEKTRGRASPDRHLEKALCIQLRQKHLLLKRVAHTPLRYGTNVNTPLPSPSLTPQVSSRSFKDSAGLSKGREKNGKAAEKPSEIQQKLGPQVVGALTSWASGSQLGRSGEQRNSGRRGRESSGRVSFGESEAGFGGDVESGESHSAGHASAQKASQKGAASRATAEEGRLSFRGASIGFGGIPPMRVSFNPQGASSLEGNPFGPSQAGSDTSHLRTRADSFAQFAGPVFRTVDQSLSLSPVDIKSPRWQSAQRDSMQQRRFESPLEQLAFQSDFDRSEEPRDSFRSEGTEVVVGDIEYEDVPYDSQPEPSQAAHLMAVNEVDSKQRRRTQQAGPRQTPPSSSRRVNYDDIPVRSSATATFRNVPDLSMDVPPRSKDPSENNSPSDKPAKRPFLRARGGRLGTSVSIPEHLKLAIPEPPAGFSSDLGPSTAPGNFGGSLFSEGRRVQSRAKREQFGAEAEISVLEREDEGEESEEPRKRAFLQRKSKAMPMQKLDWSKVKPLVEARLDPERYGALQRQASFKKEEPPPLPDYRNVKSRLLAYREPNTKYLAQGEEAPLDIAEPRSPRSMVKSPRHAAARQQRKVQSSAHTGQALSESDAHVSDGEARKEGGKRQKGSAVRREAWEEMKKGSRPTKDPAGQLTAGIGGADKIGRSRKRGERRSSAAESAEDVGSRLSAAGQMVERLYRSLQLERGLEFSSLFSRRGGQGDSVIPRLRSDDPLFHEQADALYKKLTVEKRFEGLRADSLTFVSAKI